MATSSANPHKLDDYATEGAEMISTLRTKVNEATDALETLLSSNSEHLPRYPGLADLLVDVVDDWAHQDEFVGDVAHGFFAANGGEDATEAGAVLEFDDETLLTMGEIGFADRDVAIAAAEMMADELDRLREQDEGVSFLDMAIWAARARRGQYDPAFAVTFSEQVGVEGYADATAMFEFAYNGRDGREIEEAIPGVMVLSTMLTTALDTLPRGENDEYRDPSNADLPDGSRLSEDFVHDLTTGYEPDDTREGPKHPWGHTGPDDLALVIGMSDPPTTVAIDIAEERMEPYLRPGSEAIQHSAWPENLRDPVVNYASMLARNPDASAGWLHGEGNIELALDTANADDGLVHTMADGGEALAAVVEAGLTNDDLQVPGDDGRLMREELMDRTISHIGDASAAGEFDIGSDHMYDALASGVESNMDYIGERINGGWELDASENYQHSGTDGFTDTSYFFSEMMADEDAAERVRTATFDYVESELASLEPGADGYLPRGEVHDAGRILGTLMHGDLAALDEAYDEGVSEAAATQKVVNFGVGWIPILGDANTTSDVVTGISAGSLIEPPDLGEFADSLDEAEQGMDDSVEGLDLSGGRDFDAIKAAMYDIGRELTGSAYTHG